MDLLPEAAEPHPKALPDLDIGRRSVPLWGPVIRPDGVRFRLWAPGVLGLALRTPDGDLPMTGEDDGWFEIVTRAVSPGDSYGFVLPDGRVVPDPAARAQAGDVHGLSRLVDPDAYAWRTDWAGRPWETAAICEIHVGTFTPEGTFAAAAEKLGALADAGFTAVELMPVAQFAGDRGWGYDGVLPFAPHPAYGTPDEMKAFIDRAHETGLMVLLDVVYNHFGPEGNYLGSYAPDFFAPGRETPWGIAIAFETGAVRHFFVDNALYWIEEFRLDGLRLDAIDHVRDPSDPEILVDIAKAVRRRDGDHPVHLTTEDNRNITWLHHRDDDGSVPLHTAEWNDDFHNVAHVIATGETEGYYEDFDLERWSLFARTLAEGFAFQGQVSRHAGAERGFPSTHQPPDAFVDFLQNHDQIGNRGHGERLTVLAEPPVLKALTAILLLAPHIPLMFMGEDYGETRPFLFFAGFEGDLARSVSEGRQREFAAFGAYAAGNVPDPIARSTFEASKLDWAYRASAAGQATLATTRALLTLRAAEIAPRLPGTGGHAGRILCAADGAVGVDWKLNGAVLRLRANLLNVPLSLPSAAGRVIHATGELGAPYSAVFFLDEEGA